ncbi:Uncharacterised protein [Halioglobus japonicus]|nr:Uncharacterised protein [Halioglobus japonicus]
MIVARPNSSAHWNTNVSVLLALAVPMLCVAIPFALTGAWLILPFAGVELLALGIALYRVNHRLQYRHVITVSGDTVCIDKGYDTPEEHWQLARHNSGLTVTTQQHPWDAPQLCLHDRDVFITLGEFLNREDSLKLLELLQQEFRVRALGQGTLQEF